MSHSRNLIIAAALVALAGCNAWRGEPDAHGPQWIERPVDNLVAKMGPPDRKVRLPPPSLSTVLLYLGGAQPGFAICERDYFIRGAAVVGYNEHGSAPGCSRRAGNTE